MTFTDFPGKENGNLGTINCLLPSYTFKVINFSFRTFRFAYTVFFQVSLSKSLLT